MTIIEGYIPKIEQPGLGNLPFGNQEKRNLALKELTNKNGKIDTSKLEQVLLETNKDKKETIEQSKKEQKELSDEKLATITNNDFLRLSPEKRLVHITKNNISAKEVASGETKKLEFTFTFNGKFNKELYMQTTAGQVLPQEVEVVEKNGITYKRDGLKGEFFTNGGKRLTIKDSKEHGAKEATIIISKLRTKEDIKNLENLKIKEIKNFKDTKDYRKGFDDLIEEAVKRKIDPKFALEAFKDRLNNKALPSVERRILIEDMFTEYDRIKGKHKELSENEVKLLVLKKFTGNAWKQKAEKAEIPKDIIKKVEQKKVVKENKNFYIDSPLDSINETYKTKEEFYKISQKYAKEVEKIYGVPWQVTFAQSIIESGHGTSKRARTQFNFFGHTNNKKDNLAMDGGVLNNFAKYNSIRDGFLAHGKFLRRNPRYAEAFKYTHNPRKFLETIVHAGYVYKKGDNERHKRKYIKLAIDVLKARGVYI